MTDADSRPDGPAVSDANDCMNGVQLMTAANDNDPGTPARGRWQRGHSGNPRGKPKGTRHNATYAVENLLAGDAKALTRTVITLALDGDIAALKMCLDRLAPPRRAHPVTMTLPPIHTSADVDAALSELLAAMARGEVAPEQAITIAQIFELKRKCIETRDIEARLAKLEHPQHAEEA